MNTKKFLGILLCVAMAFSCVSFASADEVKLTGEVNKYGFEVPEETITFSIYSCDDDATDQSEEDERLAQVDEVMKNEFNMEVHKLVYSQDSEERLNLMLASNDYPEVIANMSDTMANSYILQGRALELTDAINNYAPTLKEQYGDFINLLREEDGSLYKLSSSFGNTTDVMGSDFSIRWDWLQETGLEAPNSFESYYEAIKAIVALHPTNDNGEKVYGFTAFTLKGEEFYSTPLKFLGLYSTSTGTYKLNDDGSLSYWVDTDEGRYVAKYINQFWRDGLIDPDFQTKDYESSKSFMSNERVAGNIGTWWHNFVGGHQVWELTDENYTIDKRMQELTWQETDATPNLISNNYIRSYRVIFTDKCTNLDAIMHYVDWTCTPLGIAFTSMGPEGEDKAWFINENGEAQVSDMYWYGNPDSDSWSWGDFEYYDCGGSNYGFAGPTYTPVNKTDNPAEGWASPVVAVNAWDLIPDYSLLDPDKMSVGNQMYLLDAETSTTYLTDMTAWNISLDPDSDEATIYQDVKEALLSDWCKCIMAETEEECDQLYDEMVEDMHDLGVDQLTAVQQEAYNTNMSKLDGSYWND